MESDIIIVCDATSNFLHFTPQNFDKNNTNEQRIKNCVESYPVKSFEKFVLEMFEVKEIYPTFIKLSENSQNSSTRSVSEVQLKTDSQSMIQKAEIEAKTSDQQQIALNIEIQNNQLVATNLNYIQSLAALPC